MPKYNKAFFAVTALATVALSASAVRSATVIPIFDRLAFEAELSSFTTETFNGIAVDQSFNGLGLGLGTFMLSADPTLATRNKIDVPPFETNVSGIDGSAHASFFLSNSQAVLVFDSAVTALGFDQNAFGNTTNGTTSISILGETAFEVAPGSPSAPDFLGFVSDTPFNSVVLSSTSPNDGFSIDNLTYGDADIPMVPLPASLPLVALTLGLLAWRTGPALTRKFRAQMLK